MKSLRVFLSKFFLLRQSPKRWVRVVWWTVILGTSALILLSPRSRSALLAVWLTSNIFYTLAAITWSLLHLKAVFRAREAGFRWAVWFTLFAALLTFSQLYVHSLKLQGIVAAGANINPPLILLITLMLCPLLFLCIVNIGLCGVALGAFAARNYGDIKEAAGSIVRSLYGVIALLGLEAIITHESPRSFILLILSLPLLSVGFYRLTSSRTLPLKQWRKQLQEFSDRYLKFHFMRRNHVWSFDSRGLVAGLLAVGIMLAAPSALITPLKTLALVTLMQAQATSTYFVSLVGNPIGDRLAESRNRIVMLDLDAGTRREILEPNWPEQHRSRQIASEAVLQAQIIAKLHAYGASQIVLPTPILHPRNYVPLPAQPAPQDDDITATRRDVRKLTDVMKQAGNVIMILPPHVSSSQVSLTDDTPDDKDLSDLRLKLLIAASHAVCTPRIAQSSTARLPMIPVSWKRFVPAPILLCAGETGRTNGILPTYQKFDLAKLAGKRLPIMTHEGVLINFVGQGPQLDFTHVSYSSLLNNQPIFVANAKSSQPLNAPTGLGADEAANARAGKETHSSVDGSNLWIKPELFFRDKIVFLDSLSNTLQSSPVGVMKRAEVFAYGTSTLLSGDSIRRFSPTSSLLWTLLIGLYIGGSCFSRPPIDAIWRTSIPVFLITLASFLLFLFRSIWFDPVQPLGTALIALCITTQYTFNRERSEKQRTRALFQRFVAPQKVDELLSRPEATLGLGGQRQTVSVLFADVRNFTGFAELHEADKVIEVINIYMGALTGELHRFDGVLDKYTGDGLMAWFPVGKEPAADVGRAVEAALAMRDAALKISETMPLDERLNIGIGLHYGDAVVGLVGREDLQVNWTALGYTVVVSARLQTIAGGGEVIISEQVNALVAGRFQVRESEPVRVKGITLPIRPYLVIGQALTPLLPAPPAIAPPLQENVQIKE